MRKVKLFTIDALPYRQPIPVYGYRFGSRKKTLAVMGAIRGDEVQQMYVAARLVRKFSELEKQGAFAPDLGVLVVPCAGQFSMNVSKRFWPLDNTDINRMFPGYSEGETTQRLADRIFRALQGYRWGVHLASFYLPGDFVPHVRIMDTGYQPNEEGLDFGLPYLMIRKPHPYDTTTLNYNWQVWETRTFSIYSRTTDYIDEESAEMAADSVLYFLAKKGMLPYKLPEGVRRFLSEKGLLGSELPEGSRTKTVKEENLVNIHNKAGGILIRYHHPADFVREGNLLAEIIDPYTTDVREKIRAPKDGTLFFAHHGQLIAGRSIVFRLIPKERVGK
ncbi:MAG: succinylglutamate desuccinylase/aspartoacylase family protein [Acidaminococcaceae bacterium]|nr:succinylglutamate desuccinylase/aspartoacylase family protein [Acidaminococcaceae bacterium]MBQ9635857.1 succinylglutamate desuccinylase/aspartoacylase family protein [Acidaminococcaceae bacterium]MBR1590122.1 succinylglutamate desuccinylase/aspartoacylase family protein [Acidaminococcaceae bacterium]